jgi:hypothetical protein
MKDRKDQKVIKAFVNYLGLEVDEWPEDYNQNDIDAIAGPLAIEHTSVDTLPNRFIRDILYPAMSLKTSLRSIVSIPNRQSYHVSVLA